MLNKLSRLFIEVSLLTATTLSYAYTNEIELSQVNINVNGNIQRDDQINDIIQSKYQGAVINSVTLQDILNEITTYYRENGYPSSRAYLPEQNIQSSGIVEIEVVYSTLDQVNIIEKDDYVNDFAKNNIYTSLHVLEGENLNSELLSDKILRLADLNQFDINAILEDSDDGLNKTNLDVYMQGKPKYTLGFLIDNHGIESTGVYRAQAFVNFNNVSKSLDNLTFAASASNAHHNNFNLTYELPFNSRYTKSISSICLSNYELAKEYKSLGANGEALTLDTQINDTLKRSFNSKIDVATGIRYRKLKDSFDAFNLDLKKHSISLYQELNTLFSLNENATLKTNSKLTLGKIYSDDDYDLFESNSFLILNNNVNLTYQFNDMLSTALSFDSQIANKPLDGSEYFSLGGADYMAAYKSNTFNGDDGFILTSKLNIKPFSDVDFLVSPNIQFGYVNLKEFNSEKATSLGIDLSYNNKSFFVKAQNNLALTKFEDTDTLNILLSLGYIYS